MSNTNIEKLMSYKPIIHGGSLTKYDKVKCDECGAIGKTRLVSHSQGNNSITQEVVCECGARITLIYKAPKPRFNKKK